jgi:hypothetical protein
VVAGGTAGDGGGTTFGCVLQHVAIITINEVIVREERNHLLVDMVLLLLLLLLLLLF